MIYVCKNISNKPIVIFMLDKFQEMLVDLKN